MRASLEIHAGTLRIHPDDGEFGDPYVWACGITMSGGIATLYGAMSAPTPAMIRAARDCLRSYGVKEIRFERRAGGKQRRFVEVEI